MPLQLNRSPPGNRMRQGSAVDQLQLTTERHAVGDTRSDQPLVSQQLGNVMRRRLAFHGRVRSQDDLGKTALGNTHQQIRNADGLWPQAVERRKMALEHEVAPAKTSLLHRVDIHRSFHHAQQAVIATRIEAQLADLILAEAAALLAVTNALHRLSQRLSQAHCATAITLEHLQRHALSSLLPHPRQDAQGIDQLADQWAEAHGSTRWLQECYASF